MPMNLGGAAMMAGGGGSPMMQQGMPPSMPPVAQDNQATTQISQVLDVLKQILPQVVDQNGYVNMDKLITLWPQFSKVPFQTVMQLINQNPELLTELVTQFGLSGISFQGRIISADELAALGGRGGR